MRTFDVAIVGAGPAGSALATHLARDGFSVLLLEKNRFPRDKVCGDLVSARALKSLQQLGCYADIEQHEYLPINESFVFLDGERLVDIALPVIPEHLPFLNVIPRIELDEFVFNRAVSAGAQVREHCSVIGYDEGRGAVGIEADVGGRRRRFRSRIIVGADGASSTVARAAGLEMRDARYVQLAMRAYCRGLPLEQTVLYFEEDFFPGFGWIFPVNRELANVGVGMVKESAQRDRIRLKEFYSRFVQFIRNMACDYGADIELTRSAGWPIKTFGGAGPNYFERGLLIGDAGSFVDPISGEGIPFALETAEMAAGTIRDAFGRGDFSSDSLSSFERNWRERYDADLGVSDLIVSTVRNRHLAKLWIHCLKVIGMTAARDPAYASKVGGIIAGLVPNRDGLSSDVALKSMLHGPDFWMQALDLSPETLSSDLLRRSVELLTWQRNLASSIVSDVDWFQDWATEIGRKQIKVLDSLLGSKRR